jgi:hypothetical protein
MRLILTACLLALATLAASCGSGASHFVVLSNAPGDSTARDVIANHGGELVDALQDQTGRRLHPLPVIRLEPKQGDCAPSRSGYDPDAAAVVLYLNGTERDQELLGLLAHELGHALAYQEAGQRTDDEMLAEGFATWAGAWHWSRWQPWRSLDEAAVAGPPESDGCDYAAKDHAYASWASFTSYLEGRFGIGMLFRALRSTAEDPFLDAYNVSAEELAAEWRTALEDSSTGH